MSSYAHLGVLVLLVTIPASTGNPGGTPKSACVDMSPQHGAVEQTSTNKFSLDWNTTQGDDTLKVCVKGGTFKGILLQMRAVGDTVPIGTFNGTKGILANDTKTMACTAESDTVTHSKPTLKKDPTCFYWKAPNNTIPQNVHFVATIVEIKAVYWINVTSDVINPPPVITTSGPPEVTTATSDASTTDTTATSDASNTDTNTTMNGYDQSDLSTTTTARSTGAAPPGAAFTTCVWCSLLAIVASLRH